jgi:hypothetical protein
MHDGVAVIALEKLIDLALGELASDEAERLEPHLLGCSACAERLERLILFGDGIRDLVRGGKVRFPASTPLYEALARAGLVTRVYQLAPGETVACAVDAGDLYTALRLRVDLAGVERVDFVRELDGVRARIEDLPMDRERGLVTIVERADLLRTQPGGPRRLKLLAVAADGDRELASYTLDHTAFVT